MIHNSAYATAVYSKYSYSAGLRCPMVARHKNASLRILVHKMHYRTSRVWYTRWGTICFFAPDGISSRALHALGRRNNPKYQARIKEGATCLPCVRPVVWLRRSSTPRPRSQSSLDVHTTSTPPLPRTAAAAARGGVIRSACTVVVEFNICDFDSHHSQGKKTIQRDYGT